MIIGWPHFTGVDLFFLQIGFGSSLSYLHTLSSLFEFLSVQKLRVARTNECSLVKLCHDLLPNYSTPIHGS
ncbi:hypothetical protein BDZ94DRAFT_333531 [Collybia nuda]|uniref:Uncharacterized protein n=1 Tax=Collybia nuda TaxID=64659 RepID=A0A9P6CC20_9AGAR|nr:hypothetical protein BDZ94DRAFT_333531 [Collybia nuda]